MAEGSVRLPHDPAHVWSSLGGSDDESGARRVQRVGADPRKSEVVRTSRFNAEDAEFKQEDTEELSAALTTYRRQLSRTSVSRDAHGPSIGSPNGAVDVQDV